MEEFILIEKMPFKVNNHNGTVSTNNKYDTPHSYYGMPAIEVRGENTLFWSKNGNIHNDNDCAGAIKALKSRIFSREYNHVSWCVNGKFHRNVDKPSIITTKGAMIWCKKGKIHRENDKPAVISNFDGYKAWKINGKFYERDNDKPNLIIGDNLFWIGYSEKTNTEITIKHEHKNKLDNFIAKKSIPFGIAFGVVIFLLITFA